MSDMKNIYDVLDEIGFENQCEKYALGFQRDTDTPTMTKFRQESMKQFCFSLIQQYAEKVYEDFIRTRKALDVAKDTIRHADWFFDGDYNVDAKTMRNEIKCVIKGITALEQKD